MTFSQRFDSIYSPEHFVELERVQSIFRIFELDSVQVGSGRPGGDRNHLWGSIVILARASLEEALRRLHLGLCDRSDCGHERVSFDPSKFRRFLDDHDVKPARDLPDRLHVSMRLKMAAKGGDGSASRVNGPLTGDQVLELLTALNHTRNGFAHQNPKKMARLPESGSGLLWVPAEDGTAWTVQKPHAFSTMRYCEASYRWTVLSIWGPDKAMDTRRPLPLMLGDSIRAVVGRDLNVVAERIVSLATAGKLREVLLEISDLRMAVIASNQANEHAATRLSLSFDAMKSEVVGPLFDPVIPDRACEPIHGEVVPTLFGGVDL